MIEKKREYSKAKNKKLAEHLGIRNMAIARKTLVKMVMLNLLQQLDMDNCFRCKQKVVKIEDISLDHGNESWRTCADKNKAQELFWDLDNLFVSHKWCNTPDYNRGTNKNGYIGVTQNIYKPTGNTQYCAEIRVNNQEIKLGYSKDPKIAAFFRDIGIFKYRDGNGILNFENLRSVYPILKDREWRSFSDEEVNGIFRGI